jgi:hypothetical protein
MIVYITSLLLKTARTENHSLYHWLTQWEIGTPLWMEEVNGLIHWDLRYPHEAADYRRDL